MASTIDKRIKVSVIIPVFNTEDYLHQAVDSILTQTLKELEIIIINDGSTDNSLQIIKQLTETDTRIRFYSQENNGPSISRNMGISHARGKYIYFMDSDDLLEPDALALCYHKCEIQQLDFVFFDAKSFYEEGVESKLEMAYNHTDPVDDRVYSGLEVFEAQILHNKFTPSPCLSFINREFIESHKLYFKPGILHEDQLFTTFLYLNALRTSCIKRSFFNRRIRKDSIMTRQYAWRNVTSYLAIAKELLHFRKIQTQRIQTVIDLFLSQMLNAAVWQAYMLPFMQRLRLAFICLFCYRKYVRTKTLATLMLKKIIKMCFSIVSIS